MLRKPKIFNYLTIGLLGIILCFPIQIMILYGHYPWELTSVLPKLSILNWLVMIGCGYTAYTAYIAAPQFKLALPILSVLVAWNNLIVGYVGYDYNITSTFLSTIIFSSVNLVFFQREVQILMADTNKRWWLHPQRYQATVPVFVSPNRGEAFNTDTFDISSTGTFIALKPQQAQVLNLGEVLSLSFKLGTFRTLRCDAKIIRNEKARGRYPEGIGIQFMNLNRDQQNTLNQYFRVAAPPPLREGAPA